MLAALSFAYGVLHAAGPGHGKAVISSYVLADGRTVRRGILLAFLAALIQALSALVLVGVLVLVLRATGLQIRAMEAWLETASWALVALVGVWLLYYQLRSAFAALHWRTPGITTITPITHHAHHDAHAHSPRAARAPATSTRMGTTTPARCARICLRQPSCKATGPGGGRWRWRSRSA